MKVTTKKSGKEMTFKDTQPGQCFRLDSAVWLRLLGDNGYTVNAARLYDGQARRIPEHDPVEPLNMVAEEIDSVDAH